MNEDRIRRSWSGDSSSSEVLLPKQLSDKEFLCSKLPSLVKNFDWEVKNEFSKSLDDLKKNGNDWRMVASRLGFSNIIQQLEKVSKPTIELLRQCTDTTCIELLDILVNIDRSDVLDDVVKHYNKRNTNSIRPLCLRSPTQEGEDGKSTFSGLSWPLQDSGCESSISKVGPEESDETEEDFHSDESKTFWLNIPGTYDRKSWMDFFQAAKNTCPKEIQQGNVQKFLSKLLGIEYATDNIRLNQFLELVALFGPFKPGREGCLQKMCDLMKDSISVRDDGAKESWFAGRMNETESYERLRDQIPGHFLLRISSSKAHDGVFVLAVKTRGSGVVQIQIKRDLQNSNLLLADREFENLKSLVDDLRRDVLLENCKQLLINPCPGLPLNAIFTGYVDGKPRQGGRGRGKPRK
ncbi:unnamed protein product [Pocillopora meandrina]|uniref:SH2 domain-containing protein n=1 Tax=Pocillopora meandrina TaxID=46732 RepID=A0AAU9WZV2_9CNID|nr:unnamed protein product [Pocillopora meandrina]